MRFVNKTSQEKLTEKVTKNSRTAKLLT